MTIYVEGNCYSGSPTEIAIQLNHLLFDQSFNNIEAYLHYMQQNYIRVSGKQLVLPNGNTDCKAFALFKALNAIGAMQIVEVTDED
jgi:hypothetical protein